MDIAKADFYESARKQGSSRPGALLHAVRIYRNRHPAMDPENAAGDSAHMLLQGARAQK